MAEEVQISCITKNPRFDIHHRIERVGGFHNGAKFNISLDEAIGYIERREFAFYTLVGGHKRRVIVATRLGRKYLKTEADHDTPDNLLSLPDCR